MRAPLLGLVLLLLTSFQNVEQPPAHGIIFGRAVTSDGKPAKNVQLEAMPLGVALATILPHARTDETGKYRVSVPWWGRFTVYGDDAEAGYSAFATGCGGTPCPEVALNPSHPEAELNVRLLPRAGFVEIHLTNRKTGAVIDGMFFDVFSAEKPDRPINGGSWPSNKPILIPPNKDLLLHVRAPGFSEWRESVGKGKPVRVSSGERLRLVVQLDPAS